MYRDFAQVGQEFSHNNDFAFVYIEEAHATDEWPISSSRYTPDGQVVSVEQPKVASERVKLAQRFVKTFGMGTEMKVLVDNPENGNLFGEAYAPWPIRLYVIENGTMQFISAPTDCAHDVSELRAWLEKRHESK
mmetsp:Transcript_25911/g.40658  ORF Transcript_25911/g.40658 Transcript_25911/m.40658 type:complete len:134 (+) Transcript_25911:1603-2004(+)